jgi:hypothetical protein
MKMKAFLLSISAALLLTGCGSFPATTQDSTGSTATTQDALGAILSAVLGGTSKITTKQLIGSWKYNQPDCAFTSDQLLAQAGGEVVATQLEAKMKPVFQKIGIKNSNTSVTFNQDGTFAASFAGKSFSGNYTFDESTSRITMQGLLLTINGYVRRSNTGIALLFESSKLLTLLQTISALSGNTSLQGIGEIAKSYDGLRMGFEFL